MAIEIELKIEPAKFRIQGEATLSFVILNRGKETVEIVDPTPKATMPRYRMVDLDTGEESVFQNKPSLFYQDDFIELEPGGKFDHEADLNEVVKFSSPGTYEISVEYEWNGGRGVARSNVVRIEVAGSTTQNLSIVSSAGGLSREGVAIWTERGEKVTELFLARVGLVTPPSIYEKQSLGEIPPSARPVPSIPKNRQIPSHRWIAWLEGSVLRGLRLQGTASDGGRIKPPDLPDLPTEIVPPLMPVGETNGDDDAAVILRQTAETGQSALQVAIIEPDGNVVSGPAISLRGSFGQYGGRCVALSDGERRVYILGEEDFDGERNLILQGVSWPVGSKEMKSIALETIPGRWIASTVEVNQDDTVFGAVLTVKREGPTQITPVLYPWAHKSGEELTMGLEMELSWPSDVEVSEARLGVNSFGEVFGVLRASGGEWMAFSGDDPDLQPVEGPTGRVEIIMLETVTPALMFGQPGMGIHFTTLEGKSFENAPHA